MVRLKLRQIGTSVGVILPKEVLARLKVEKGDEIVLSETAEGFKITPYDPEFLAQMDAAEEIMKRRRNLLRALAR
jgi:putative addiction module antidote